jgi:tetratricopeptide (TPR) repeat protein
MADNSTKDSDATSSENGTDAHGGKTRSKWLDSLIKRLDEDGIGEPEPEPDDAPDELEALEPAPEDIPDLDPGATEDDVPEVEPLEPAPEDVDDLELEPAGHDVPEVEPLEPAPEDIPDMVVEPRGDRIPEVEPLQMLRSGEYREIDDDAVSPPPVPPPPAKKEATEAKVDVDQDVDGLSFTIGDDDDVDDDAPFGVPEASPADSDLPVAESRVSVADVEESLAGQMSVTATEPADELELEPPEAEPLLAEPADEPSEVEVEPADEPSEAEVEVEVAPEPADEVEPDESLAATDVDAEEEDDVDEEGPTLAFERAEPEVEVEEAEPPDESEAIAVETPPLIEDEPEEEEEHASVLAVSQELAVDDDPVRIEAALEREAESTDDKTRKALIQHELGHLLQNRLNNESRAAKAYAQALNLDPLLRPNVWAIARIFGRRELWTNLIKLYDAQVRFERDDRRKSEILLEKGWVLLDHVGDSQEARASFWAAYEANETWLAPLLALEKLDLAQGDMEDLAQVYRHMAETAVDPARRASVLVDLARLQEKLPDGTPQVALTLLERARSEGGDTRFIMRVAEQIATAADLHQELVEVLKRQAEEEEAEGRDRLNSVALLRHAAAVAREKMEDLGQALELLELAAELAENEPVVQRDLLAIAEELGDWERVERVLKEQLAATADDRQRAAIAFRIGLARLQSSSDASDSLTETMVLLPGYLPALAEKERRLLAANDTEGLVELYLSEADAVEQRSAGLPLLAESDPDWAAEALWRAATLVRRDSPDRAVELCQRALTLKPGFQLALDELEKLYQVTGRHRELADLLERETEAAGVTDEQAAYLLETLAALCGGALDDPIREMTALGRLRALDREDVTILRRLARVLERLERYNDLDEVLRELDEREQDEALQVQWKLARGHINETHRDQPDVALTIYRAILERSPTHPYAFPAAENLLRRSSRFDDLAKLLRQAADDTLDQDLKCELLIRLASVYSRHLDSLSEAAAVYLELTELKPDDPVVLRTLFRAAVAAGDPQRMVEAQDRLVEQEGEPTARVRHMLRLAELLDDKLDEQDRAEETLQKAIETAAGTPIGATLAVDALEALARRKLARGDYMEAKEHLEQLAREGPEEARALLLEEQAWLAAGPLADLEAGAELWHQTHEGDSNNQRAMWAKLRIGARRRNLAELSAALSLLAGSVEDQTLAGILELRAGLMCDAVGDTDGHAVGCYQRALNVVPDNLEALTALLAKSSLNPDQRAELSARLAEVAPDRVREETRLELARTFEKAGRGAAAGEEVARLLEKDPDNLPALVVLQRLAQAATDRELELRVWTKIGGLLSNRTARAEAFGRAGELLVHPEVARPAQAAVLFRHVLALRPDDGQAFEHLHRIYRDLGDDKGLEELLGHRIRHTAEDRRGVLIGLHFERAQLRLKHADIAGAASDMGQVLRHDPDHLEALKELARLYDEDGNAAKALTLYNRYLEAADSSSLRRPIALRVAQLLQQINRTADAVDVCKQFLDQSPDDVQVLQLLVELYADVRDFSRAIETLERLGNLREEPEWKADTMRQIARLHWKQMKDPQEARSTLLRARDVDPVNVEVVDDLRHLSEQMGLQDDLQRLFERAKDDVRERLSSSPADGSLYRKLLQISEWHEDTYTLLASLGVLCLLGEADAQDQELYRRRASMLSFEPKRQSKAPAWRGALMARGAKSAFGEIWAVIAPTVTKLYEERGLITDPAVVSVTRADKAKAGGPVRLALDPVAAVFGLGDFDIYVTRSAPDMIRGVVGERQALVLGHNVVSAMGPVQRFRVGRTMSMLRDRAFALEVLDRDELERIFSAAIFKVEPTAPLPLPAAEIEPEANRLYKALPRKARKGLSLAVTRYLQEGGELDDWIAGVLATANRSGLLACGEIQVALGELVGDLRDPARRAPREVVRIVEQNAQVARLLVFSVSSDYLNLRGELRV